jgi:hypothetical protein
MSAVVYIRAPDSLKQALKDYALVRGLTETAAAVSLLERALAAIADEASVEQLKRKLEGATRELETTRAALHEVELRERAAANIHKALAKRAYHPLTTHMGCGSALSGADLYAGACPECGAGITDLLTPTRGDLKDSDYLPFVGVLGALLGMTLDSISDDAG